MVLLLCVMIVSRVVSVSTVVVLVRVHLVVVDGCVARPISISSMRQHENLLDRVCP